MNIRFSRLQAYSVVHSLRGSHSLFKRRWKSWGGRDSLAHPASLYRPQVGKEDLLVVAILGEQDHRGSLAHGCDDNGVELLILPILGQGLVSLSPGGIPRRRTEGGVCLWRREVVCLLVIVGRRSVELVGI